MSLTELIQGFAIYGVLWWLTFFAVLPWGVRSQRETGEVVPGSESGAPSRPLLLRKVLATTLLAALLFAGIHWLIYYSGLTLDNIPFFPSMEIDR